MMHLHFQIRDGYINEFVLHHLLLESSSNWIYKTSIVMKSSSKVIAITSNITPNKSYYDVQKHLSDFKAETVDRAKMKYEIMK